MGYYRAGFDVVGVDIHPQPRYPFAFVQADALDYLDANWWLFDAYHASPPCQGYSTLAFTPNRNMDRYGDLIEPVRGYFQDICKTHWKPWIIENVIGAPLNTTLMLCGTMFGLNVFRHRNFESNILLWSLPHKTHEQKIEYNPSRRQSQYFSDPGKPATIAGHLFSLEVGQRALGIDWAIKRELAQAIPPVYTEYIGRQFMQLFEVSNG